MLLQPPLGGLCRVTRRLVLLQFPPIPFVLKQLLSSRQQRLLQNVLVCVCVESTFIQYQFSFSLELNPPHASTVSPHRSISFPGTSLTDLAQTKLCRGLPPLNCLNVCSSLNTTLLQSFLALALANRNRPR